MISIISVAIFSITNCIQIYSGNFSFEFQEDSNPLWRICPKWISKPDLFVRNSTDPMTLFIIPRAKLDLISILEVALIPELTLFCPINIQFDLNSRVIDFNRTVKDQIITVQKQENGHTIETKQYLYFFNEISLDWKPAFLSHSNSCRLEFSIEFDKEGKLSFPKTNNIYASLPTHIIENRLCFISAPFSLSDNRSSLDDGEESQRWNCVLLKHIGYHLFSFMAIFPEKFHSQIFSFLDSSNCSSALSCLIFRFVFSFLRFTVRIFKPYIS